MLDCGVGVDNVSHGTILRDFAERTPHTAMGARLKIGFVGTGTITSAIVTGMKSAFPDRDEILLSPRNESVAGALAARFPRVSVAASNQGVLDGSDIVVLAVRPQMAREVISQLRFRSDHHVVSLVAAVSVEAMSLMVAPATAVTRAVPLPFIASREGPVAIYPPDALVAQMFTGLGDVIQVEDVEEFDTLCSTTAVMATYFNFADTVASWATQHGVPPEHARRYVASIFQGLAHTAIAQADKSFATLAAEHTTRGGINDQVTTHLAERGVFGDLSAALDGVLKRIRGVT